MQPLHPLSAHSWEQSFSAAIRDEALTSLEEGKVIHLPQLAFVLGSDEQRFLSPQYADPYSKNINYHVDKNKVFGVQQINEEERDQLKSMLNRFSQHATQLIKNLFPGYVRDLIMGRTSFRPVQIDGRVSSYRKDDKRLHVDAFPSAPNQGMRILRVFSNINPHGEDRVWRIGEPFEQVADRFCKKLHKPWPGMATILRALRITKSRRTLYDHYMLQLHNNMKADEDYQKTVAQTECRFAPGCSWIVQTDHVSHAAMRGQHALEQTFYLPVAAMQNESCAPLRVLEKHFGRELV